MKSLKVLTASIAALGIVGTAQAGEGDAYVNVGVDTLEFDSYGIGGKVGYQFTDYFGVEGQGSVGIIDDEQTIGNIEVDIGYDYLVSGFGVATLPLSDGFELLGRVGYYYAEVSAEAAGTSVSDDEDGLAFGVGGQYMWDKMNGIRADYTYLDGDGGHADVASLSYVRKF